MSCCSKAKVVKNIISGYSNYTFHGLFKIPNEKAKDAAARINECTGCEFVTWLTKLEYIEWSLANRTEILKNINDLTHLPPLDIRKRESGTSPFCSDCKCWIPAKAYSKDSQCPQDKWAD